MCRTLINVLKRYFTEEKKINENQYFKKKIKTCFSLCIIKLLAWYVFFRTFSHERRAVVVVLEVIRCAFSVFSFR
jgi:hypothetical protein